METVNHIQKGYTLNEEVTKRQIKELVRGGVVEALIEMYLAGVSVHLVENIIDALWGSKVPPVAISELSKKPTSILNADVTVPCSEVNIPYIYVVFTCGAAEAWTE